MERPHPRLRLKEHPIENQAHKGPGALALLWDLAKRRRLRLAIGLVAVVAVDLMQLYVPRIIKAAVDGLTLETADGGLLASLALQVVLLALGMVALRITWRPLLLGFGREVERDVRLALFGHLQRLHLGYYNDNPPGEIMARATNDLNNLRMAAGMGLVAAVDGFFMALCAVGFMIYISPWLTLLALIPMPLVAVTTRIQSKRLHRGFTRVQESFGRMTELVREALAGIKLVQAYALGPGELRRLDGSAREYVDENIVLARVMALFFPLMVMLTNLCLAVVVGVGGPMTVFGALSPGDFVAFSVYLGLLTWPMMAMGWVVSLIQRARSSIHRIDAILTTQPAVDDPAAPRELDLSRGLGVEVEGLTFTYPGADHPSLQEVGLSLPDGETIAVVGPVASGKSTLLALLGRLYDPPRGAVRVEGEDVRDLRLADLRAYLVQTPQEAFIFSDSVRNNLTLGREELDEAQVWRALDLAEMAEEVRDLPQGLDTVLGERGAQLSGGQRQRLSLARILLAKPPVLILDDPLSAVDTETEARILANLAQERAGRSNLIVSHRLASVGFASRIYVLDRGRVVEAGSHQELMAAQGLYHALFAEQELMSGEGV